MPAQDDAPVVVEQLSFRYQRRRPLALADVNLEVGPASITALAGANGSGKSTLLRLLTGLLRPRQGRISVLGLTPHRHRRRLMQDLRCSFAPAALYDGLTATQHLRYLGKLCGGVDKPSIAAVLDQVGLTGREHEAVRGFSFGMRQRLALACCLVPEPRLLILDEPTDAMDPQAIADVRDILRRLVDERSMSVLLSTHQLQGVEDLAEQLTVLHKGRVLLQGCPRALQAQTARVVIHVSGAVEDARAALQEAGQLSVLAKTGFLSLPAESLSLQEVSQRLQAVGCQLLSYAPQQDDMEALVLAAQERA